MKAILLVTTALIAMASLSSCSKEDYKCVCRGGFNGGHYEEKDVSASDAIKARKKCQALGNDYNVPDGIYCDLRQ